MLPEHKIDIWPGYEGQREAGDAIDGHQHQADQQQPFSRPHQPPDLRHRFAEICFLLRLIDAGARASAVRRTLSAHSDPDPATHCSHEFFLTELLLTRPAYLDEGPDAKTHINQQ